MNFLQIGKVSEQTAGKIMKVVDRVFFFFFFWGIV